MVQNNFINAPLPISPTKGGTGLSSITTQNILYGSSTNVIGELAAPAFVGSPQFFNGNLQNSTASNRFYYYDDLAPGDNGWDERLINSAQETYDFVSGHPGIRRYTLQTSSSSAASYQRGGLNTGTGFSSYIYQGGSFWFETSVNIAQLATTGTNDWNLYIGFINNNAQVGQTLNNGIYFFWQQSSSANWQIVCVNGGVATTTATSTAVATGWVRLSIVADPVAPLANFYINGISVGTISTNHPIGNDIGMGFSVFRTNGVSQANFSFDYFETMQNLTTPR